RISNSQVRHYSVEVSLRLLEGHTRLESTHSMQAKSSRAILELGSVPLTNRHIDIDTIKKLEARRNNSNDRVVFVVQGKALSQHILSRTKLAVPEVLADQRYWTSAALILARHQV